MADMNDGFVTALLERAVALQEAGLTNEAILTLLRGSAVIARVRRDRIATAETKPVHAVVVGDKIELEGDPYADPLGDHDFSFEYQVVCEIKVETPDCTVLHFEAGPSVGFPPDHIVAPGGHDDGYDEP